MNHIPPFSAAVNARMNRQQPVFGGKFEKPHFSGIRRRDEFSLNGSEEPEKSPMGGLKAGTIARVIGALLAIGGVAKGADYLILHDSVGQNEYCVKYSKSGGLQEEEYTSGRFRRIPGWDKATCFGVSPTRVTETVPTKSLENVDVTANVSIRWAPNADYGYEVMSLVYASGETDDPDLNASKEQILNVPNRALYENAIYSEFRSMVGEIASLIPASQIDSPAARTTFHDAILNGYNPQEVYDRFEPFHITTANEEGENVNTQRLLSDGFQPSLQQRIADSYGFTDGGDTPIPLILVSDADSRDNTIDNEVYRNALQDLAIIDIDKRKADEQADLNRRRGEAKLAEAQAQQQVDWTEADTQNEITRRDAKAEADANNTINASLTPDLIAYTEALAQLEAARNAAWGVIISGDGDGDAPIIVDGTNPPTATPESTPDSSKN